MGQENGLVIKKFLPSSLLLREKKRGYDIGGFVSRRLTSYPLLHAHRCPRSAFDHVLSETIV